jgi:chromosome segregation ATPase
MLTAEEFALYQSELVELGIENFRLKEQLEQLQQANTDLPNLKAELEVCEKQREEMRAQHAVALQQLKDELVSLQKKAADQAETSSRKMVDRITEVNQQIAEVARQTKEKEDQIEQLRQQARAHDLRIQQKTVKLGRLQKRAKAFEPLITFLRSSRGIPMYLEDLSVRIASMKRLKAEDDDALAELDQKVTDLHRLNDDLARKIKEKSAEIESANAKLKATTAKISDANAEIQKTKAALEEATARLADAKAATQQAIAEREAELARIRSQRGEIEQRIRDRQLQRDELNQKLEAMKSETDQELSRHNAKIQELRKKLNSIRETGDDDEIPRVDKELQLQIQRVMEEKAGLRDKTQMLQQAIHLVEEEIRDKDLEIQTLTLKMTPTPKILAMPEFQQKQLLLEELVLQNRELRNTFAEMTERIVQLKAENAEIRARIHAKTAK